MNTEILKRVRGYFMHDMAPPHIARHNAAQWVRAVRLLGDRWILRNGEARWGHGGAK